MTNQPPIGINWKKVGGRKFVAAFIVFITALSNGLFGNILDIESTALACLGFLTFIIVEGIIDFRGVENGNKPKKTTMSGGLKKELNKLHLFLKKVAPEEYAELVEGKKQTEENPQKEATEKEE